MFLTEISVTVSMFLTEIALTVLIFRTEIAPTALMFLTEIVLRYKYTGPIPEKATHIAVYSGNGRVGPLRMHEPLRLQTTGIAQPFYDSMQPPLDSPLDVRVLDADADARYLIFSRQ